MIVPQACGLAELVPQPGAVGVLSLPAHQARPGGEQRLVDDLHPARRLVVVTLDPIAGQQPGIDELPENLLGGLCLVSREHREQLVHLPNRPGPLGGHQVAEQLPHGRQPFKTNSLEGRLGVLCQRASDPADALEGLLGEQPLLAVPLLPQPVDRERHQRQRTPLALHLGDHPVHQQLAFESIELPTSRLLQRPPQPFGRGRRQRGQVLEDRRDLLVLLATVEVIVAYGEHDVHVGGVHQPAQQLDEARLHLGRVEGEQLFELVDDEHCLLELPPPAGDHGQRGV